MENLVFEKSTPIIFGRTNEKKKKKTEFVREIIIYQIAIRINYLHSLVNRNKSTLCHYINLPIK